MERICKLHYSMSGFIQGMSIPSWNPIAELYSAKWSLLLMRNYIPQNGVLLRNFAIFHIGHWVESLHVISYVAWNPLAEFHSVTGIHWRNFIFCLEYTGRISFHDWNSLAEFNFLPGIHWRNFISWLESTGGILFHG